MLSVRTTLLDVRMTYYVSLNDMWINVAMFVWNGVFMCIVCITCDYVLIYCK